LKYLLYW